MDSEHGPVCRINHIMKREADLPPSVISKNTTGLTGTASLSPIPSFLLVFRTSTITHSLTSLSVVSFSNAITSKLDKLHVGLTSPSRQLFLHLIFAWFCRATGLATAASCQLGLDSGIDGYGSVRIAAIEERLTVCVPYKFEH